MPGSYYCPFPSVSPGSQGLNIGRNVGHLKWKEERISSRSFYLKEAGDPKGKVEE